MKFFEIQGEKVTLIFLTPKGSQPQNVSTSFDKNRIKCWSYNHLAKWLEHLQLSDRPMPDRLGVVLEQCRETWKIIYNPTVEGSMTDEILEYIRDPKNFAIAREIKESVGEIERSVCDTFWTMIQELLEKKLQESGHSHKWKVARTEKWIGIFWNAALAEENKFQFAVLFEKEKAEKVHYGIARGGQLKSALDPRDERLQSRLVVEDGFRPGGAYYTGVRNWMPSETSLLTLSEANQDKTHPIPRKLVNGLWSLFEKYRENLEDLNERYPENYPSRMSPKLGSQNNTP
jgi:hypothetical protein